MTTDVPWFENDELAEKLTKEGWSFEQLIFDELSKPEHRLLVEMPEKTWRADSKQAFKGSHTNEIDLIANGRRISVKSRKFAFTCPDDIPINRVPLFIDTKRKWEKADPKPAFVVCVSQETSKAIWIDVESTFDQWTLTEKQDATRGYTDTFMQAKRSLWRPFEELPAIVRAGRDGLWRITFGDVVAGVEVKDGFVIEAAPVLQKFVGQHFIRVVRWAREKKNYSALKA